MAWHAVFPDGTFVPPHVHPTQDEFVYVLSGRYDLWLDGKDLVATAGDLVRMPKGIPHGIFNKSGETATSLFWVAPTRSLKELFREYVRRGHTIMMSTHTLEVAQNLCDRIAIIRRGRIAAAGTMDELRHHAESGAEGLEDIFLRLTGETAARDLVDVLNA